MSQDHPKDDSSAVPTAQTKHDAPNATASPSLLDELLSMRTPLARFILHPMEQIKLMGSSIRQMMGKKFDPDQDITDQTGKVILVTGGNTGLGKETILQLAKHHPARIYLAARNTAKTQAAIADIQAHLAQPIDIRHLPLDLSSFASIHTAANQFTSSSDRLDTLILNAAIMTPRRNATTASGHEIHLGTNHLGHFLLTQLLLPTLLHTAASTSDVRIITIASMAWQMSPPLPTLLHTASLLACTSHARYGASKAANIAFAAELARRYPQLTSVSLHPGVIFTGLYDASGAANPVVRVGVKMLRPFSADERQGSLNHLWAAGVERGVLRSGEYYTPVGVGGWGNEWAEDGEVGRRLWEWSEGEVGGKG
ncbi:NAD(P)-dependent short-chain dehydrogenase [Emydomyces testavorans]|uniref:NAD(P)-dependent short-chain dehydrogenase n=1 Tax=Emydomyces testavorans TaxID=2070801 RepID=A0AAF0DM70_9EURO|nr:NAD(P)-dependent short-chain dehydrogenase [Emydomyces testavorans]